MVTWSSRRASPAQGTPAGQGGLVGGSPESGGGVEAESHRCSHGGAAAAAGGEGRGVLIEVLHVEEGMRSAS
jgi:hypothetical protein